MCTPTGRECCTFQFGEAASPKSLGGWLSSTRRMYFVVGDGLRVWTKGRSRWGRQLRYSGTSS